MVAWGREVSSCLNERQISQFSEVCLPRGTREGNAFFQAAPDVRSLQKEKIYCAFITIKMRTSYDNFSL